MTKNKSRTSESGNHAFEKNYFSIEGMSCFSCVKKIESIIESKEGIADIKVNLGNKEAIVAHDSSIITKESIAEKIEKEGYQVTSISKSDTSAAQKNKKGPLAFHTPGPYLKGGIAFFAIIGFYLGILTLTSDWYFAKVQFEDYRVWILLLASGLGIQVFLYSNLRLHIKNARINGAGKTVAVSGGLSTAGMAACCAHYLVTVLPVLGVPFASTAIAALERYQPLFFFIGVLSNIFGILFMLNLMRKNQIIKVPNVFPIFNKSTNS